MLTKEDKLKMYHYLVLTRTFEDWIFYICHNQDQKNPMVIGKGYLSTGQEAISVGASYAMQENDWMAPSHRDVGAHLLRGMSMKDLLLQYMGREGSPTKGRDGNVHLGKSELKSLAFISHMGAMTAPANGVAFAMKYKGEKNAVISFYGDGAAQQGIVHEALNYAAVQKLPVVFVINNNRWAISTPVSTQTSVENLADRAVGYGMPSSICEGNNVYEVYDHVASALDRARAGEGPSMVECKSMRMSGHGTYDMAKYVPEEEFEEWKKKDPIKWAERILKEEGLADDAYFEKVKADIKEQLNKDIAEAVKHEQVRPGPQELADVYAE
ncbi:MAG: thiamine pyrophosphate-dependent dehydrogenase E1 component subunit alpha [Deltaproteobacteria bacterium]|nr:thiamine pyrophosphate-dependent dehydrogenase E1 component subunit alpha [Deltaproteobacteria bacterium]